MTIHLPYRTGLSVPELLEKAKQEEADRRKAETEKLKAAAAKFQKPVNAQTPSEGRSTSESSTPKPVVTERKDAPPYKVS
jgi:ATP synthase F1 complex assembly factor 1